MQVAVEPFNFLLLPANIQYFSVLINGQLSKGCRFDALRDLRDTRLALLWVLSIRPKFPVGISEISMYRMERYFPPGSFHSRSGQIQNGKLEDVLVSFRVF